MSMSKKVKVALASTLMLTLVSCGKDEKKSRPHVETNPICEEMDCLSTVNWKIQLPGRSFPHKARVDINGTTVLNECVSKQKYMIDRGAQPEALYLENYFVPKRGELKIQVLDLGQCDSSSSFIDDQNVSFDLMKSGLDREIVINL